MVLDGSLPCASISRSSGLCGCSSSSSGGPPLGFGLLEADWTAVTWPTAVEAGAVATAVSVAVAGGPAASKSRGTGPGGAAAGAEVAALRAEVAALKAALEGSQAEAARWAGLHGELHTHVLSNIMQK